MKKTVKEVLDGYTRLQKAAEECRSLNITMKQAVALMNFLEIRDQCGIGIFSTDPKRKILFASAFDYACGRKELEHEAEDFEGAK